MAGLPRVVSNYTTSGYFGRMALHRAMVQQRGGSYSQRYILREGGPSGEVKLDFTSGLENGVIGSTEVDFGDDYLSFENGYIELDPDPADETVILESR